MILAVILKLAVAFVGVFFVVGGIMRRVRRDAAIVYDPTIDRLFMVIGTSAITIAAILFLQSLAFYHRWGAWSHDLLFALLALALVVLFACCPVLGWKLVDEHERNRAP